MTQGKLYVLELKLTKYLEGDFRMDIGGKQQSLLTIVDSGHIPFLYF